MNRTFPAGFFCLIAAVFPTLHAADDVWPVTHKDGCLDNGIISVTFGKGSSISIRDSATGDVLLSDAGFQLPDARPGRIAGVVTQKVSDEFGDGAQMTIEVADTSELSYQAAAHRLFYYTLYENSPALVCGFGLKTPNFLSMRVMGGRPLGGGRLFGGAAMDHPMTLNGSSGAAGTSVEEGLSRRSSNSLMFTGIAGGKRRTAVWGGLRYKEFGAFAVLDHGSPSLYSDDPVGKLVDEDQTWIADDTLYLDVHTSDPFEALERYGKAMRKFNHAHPNVYDFPVLCGWSVGHISKLPNVNTSDKLIGELQSANKCGLTRYTKVALRLEPDKYHFDTEQGWWDDEHMRKFGHLVKPYDSVSSWSKAMNAENGIPYTYMQLGMPSDDFARQHPQWMLFNDASELDKATPGKNLPYKHPHHQPYVTYDYTDEEFAAHCLKAWSKLHQDGIRGVKIDYPETAWRPEGGFDDRHATTNSAYRRAFELLREAFGKDGFIDERNLGESGRPCLDVTAGLIDTQRTWNDSNGYEPEMISISGLRWYKNRTVFNYYPDTKTVHDISPEIRRSMLTMVHLTSGRLDLATSFSLFTPEITHDVSRTYPHYPQPISARPLDAFTGVADPQVYDLELTPDWHQIALFNTGKDKAVVSTAISGERVANAIGLDPTASYHAYEFWSDTYLGKLPGTARIERDLVPNGCAMVSLRKALPYPQVISTDRHILQGWVDLADVRWDEKTRTLSGTAHVIGGDPFKIVIADNGASPIKPESSDMGTDLKTGVSGGLSVLTLKSPGNSDVRWSLKYQ